MFYVHESAFLNPESVFIRGERINRIDIIFLFLETDGRNAESVYNEAQEIMDVMRNSRSNEYDERLKK